MWARGSQADDTPDALHDDAFIQHATILVPFAFTAFALDWWERRTGLSFGEDDLEPWTWLCAQRGRRINSGQYLSAVEWIQSWARRVLAWWEDFDVLVTPTVAFPPPTLPTVSDPDDPRATGQRAGAHLDEQFIQHGHLGVVGGRGFYSYPNPAFTEPSFT